MGEWLGWVTNEAGDDPKVGNRDAFKPVRQKGVRHDKRREIENENMDSNMFVCLFVSGTGSWMGRDLCNLFNIRFFSFESFVSIHYRPGSLGLVVKMNTAGNFSKNCVNSSLSFACITGG